MKKVLLLFLFLNLFTVSYNQVIRGTVYDRKTGTTIYSASVYFNGTFGGTLTDQKGNFELDISKYLSMPLTISALGYTSVTLTQLPTDIPLIVNLVPKVFELQEIVINAKSHAWERRANMVIFKNEFLGTSGNAVNCKILNEEDIRFIYDSGNDTLKAYATKPILLDNKALGYKITYHLDKFEYYRSSKSFSFIGTIIFNEDLTTDESQKKVFERKRKYTYLGSRMHFFRALWMDDLNSAGFSVKNSSNEYLTYNRIVSHKDNRTKYLKNNGNLSICYYSKTPTSFITFLKWEVYFDHNGYYDPSGIIWEGNMAQQRVADMLPFEYIPKD